MVENNYLVQERSPHDRRSVRVKLSEKGLALHKKFGEHFEKQVGGLNTAGISAEELTKSSDTLRKLERYWTAMINYGGN